MKNSNGLTGGAIAAIIICSIIALAIIAALILFAKKGTFSSKPPVSNFKNSTMNIFSSDQNTNEI